MNACMQAIARIYRYGQTRPTFVYRLLYKGTAEHRVYRRNVDKEGLFMKVVDKQTVKGDGYRGTLRGGMAQIDQSFVVMTSLRCVLWGSRPLL